MLHFNSPTSQQTSVHTNCPWMAKMKAKFKQRPSWNVRSTTMTQVHKTIYLGRVGNSYLPLRFLLGLIGFAIIDATFSPGYSYRTTIIFRTIKHYSPSINTLASNIHLCHRNLFQNGVNTFSNMINHFFYIFYHTILFKFHQHVVQILIK